MLSLVAWSILMPIMGFVPTTTVEIALLGRLFGARPVPGLASGLIVSGALWLLFGFGLGLPLPLGIWG
jgi:putative tricarboxylic transport membrane protein